MFLYITIIFRYFLWHGSTSYDTNKTHSFIHSFIHSFFTLCVLNCGQFMSGARRVLCEPTTVSVGLLRQTLKNIDGSGWRLSRKKTAVTYSYVGDAATENARYCCSLCCRNNILLHDRKSRRPSLSAVDACSQRGMTVLHLWRVLRQTQGQLKSVPEPAADEGRLTGSKSVIVKEKEV